MFKCRITNGPDRLCLLVALGSCYDDKPATPEFTLEHDRRGKAPTVLKIHFYVRSMSHDESNAPGVYLLRGFVPAGAVPSRPNAVEFEASYDANRRRGTITFHAALGGGTH